MSDVLTRIRRHTGIAVIDGALILSYADLAQRVDDRAARLRQLGVRPGERVATLLNDGSDALIASLATLAAGAVHVPVDVQLTAPERANLMASALVAWVQSTEGVLATGHASPPDPLERSAFLRHTSGTTAAAKGVLLTMRSLGLRAEVAANALGLAPGRRMLWLLPMAYHWAASVIAALSAGATVVFAARLRIADTAAIARAQGATLAYAAPWNLRRLAALPPGALTGLTEVIATTAALDPATAAALLHGHGLRLRQALGLIELGLPLVGDGGAIGAVGHPAPGFRSALLDGDGNEGELALDGPGRFDAYTDPWTPSDAVLRNGLFATGDRARRLPDGTLQLLGRLKDVINVAGLKVFPLEVEAVLLAHPAVAACRVRAAADERSGDVVAAEVVPAPGTDPARLTAELDAWCAARLTALKRPAQWTVLAALPHTGSGKVRR